MSNISTATNYIIESKVRATNDAAFQRLAATQNLRVKAWKKNLNGTIDATVEQLMPLPTFFGSGVTKVSNGGVKSYGFNQNTFRSNPNGKTPRFRTTQAVAASVTAY